MGLTRALRKSFGHMLQSVRGGATGQPALQIGVFFERPDGTPERVVERVTLLGFERIGRVLVAHVTLVAHDPTVLDLPERTAAVGARERRRGTKARRHLDDFGVFWRELWLEVCRRSLRLFSCACRFFVRQFVGIGTAAAESYDRRPDIG